MKTHTNYLVTKFFAIGAILIALLIALASISGLMSNRQQSYRSAINNISDAAGGSCEIAGPFLYVPVVHTTFTEYYTADGTFKREKTTSDTFAIVHPDTLAVTSDVHTQMRTLGIYSAPVFTTNTLSDATFTVNFTDTAEDTYVLSGAKLFFVTEIRSLQKRPVITVSGSNVNGVALSADAFALSDKTGGASRASGAEKASRASGAEKASFASRASFGARDAVTVDASGASFEARDAVTVDASGASFAAREGAFTEKRAAEYGEGSYTASADSITLDKIKSDYKRSETFVGIPINLTNGTLNVKTDLALRGALNFGIGLSGRDTSLAVSADWPSPGFTEFAYLPDTHTVTDSGFTAEWHIPFTGCYTEPGSLPIYSQHNAYKIGFTYVEPVNLYQKLHRAVTYGVLFLIVPFIVFFMFELFAKTTLHPMHYLLNGASCAVFFLLLLSLSEHIPFGVAYVTGAAAVSVLVAWYTGTVCKSAKLGALMMPVFVLLYGYLYFVLKSEDFALLIGSIFLFALLVAIMVGTRKVDWASVGKKKESEEGNL